MSIDINTISTTHKVPNIISTLHQELGFISSAREHEEMLEGSIIKTLGGFARRQEGGWSYFGQEGVFSLEGIHQVIRHGGIWQPRQCSLVEDDTETGIHGTNESLLPSYIHHLNQKAYIDFRQLIELPKGTLISTTQNDYQRHEHGWIPAGSITATSSKGIVRHREAYLLYPA